MTRNLILKLLIPLLILSAVSLYAAQLLSKTFDYSSVFLNLATDFLMVILTVYYVDMVIHKDEENRWKIIYHSVHLEILRLAFATLEDICNPFLFKIDLTIPQDFLMNLKNKHGTNRSIYYIYKVKELLTKEELFILGSEITDDKLITLHDSIRKCSFELQEIFFRYGNRLSPDVIKHILDFNGYFQDNSDIGDLSYSLPQYLTELFGLIQAIDNEFFDKFFIKPSKLLKTTKN